VVQAARDLGLHENGLRKWVATQRPDAQHAFPGHGKMKPEAAELDRLAPPAAPAAAEEKPAAGQKSV
jgi:transposase